MDAFGLPCPPLDEAGLMPMAFDLFDFFDGVDDSGIETKNDKYEMGKELENPKHHEIKNGKYRTGKQLQNLKLEPNQNCKSDTSEIGGPTSELELKVLCAGIKFRQAYEKTENLRKRKAIQIIEFQPLPEQQRCAKKSRRGASSTKLAKRR